MAEIQLTTCLQFGSEHSRRIWQEANRIRRKDGQRTIEQEVVYTIERSRNFESIPVTFTVTIDGHDYEVQITKRT